jgi:hypothetical protein
VKRGLGIAALVALACSGPSTMNHDQLESEMRQLRSLDAEVRLVEEIIAARHATHSFARGHARYLQQAAREHVEKLTNVRPGPGDDALLAHAHADALRLEERFGALLQRLQ